VKVKADKECTLNPLVIESPPRVQTSHSVLYDQNYVTIHKPKETENGRQKSHAHIEKSIGSLVDKMFSQGRMRNVQIMRTFTVTLSLNNRAHEEFNWANIS
jgi:hypothetical protein